ncbi:hypothetical protein [Hamadaea tsunoensis]|uniref:hypothetical protein n=1 Tax=Hamadaea tsunoensis TaxID=53368 RepID=UPI0003F8EACB|nr:hypothetical protein [Hamadaea tsunoensis]
MDKYQGHWDGAADEQAGDDLRRLRLTTEKPRAAGDRAPDAPRDEEPPRDGKPPA